MERNQLGGMTMYKVKNLVNTEGLLLQKEIKEWVESRDHITILSINIFNKKDEFFCTIVYRETSYVG